MTYLCPIGTSATIGSGAEAPQLLSEYATTVFGEDYNRSCPFLPYVYQNWSEEEQKSHLKGEKSLLYVAITRAIQKVIISGTGIKSDSIGV